MTQIDTLPPVAESSELCLPLSFGCHRGRDALRRTQSRDLPLKVERTIRDLVIEFTNLDVNMSGQVLVRRLVLHDGN